MSELAFLHVIQSGSLGEDHMPRVDGFCIDLEAELRVRALFTLRHHPKGASLDGTVSSGICSCVGSRGKSSGLRGASSNIIQVMAPT